MANELPSLTPLSSSSSTLTRVDEHETLQLSDSESSLLYPTINNAMVHHSNESNPRWKVRTRYTRSSPQWNGTCPRAMANVYIPREEPACTRQLMHYVDEDFDSVATLYYFCDYSIAMQIVDGQAVCFTFDDTVAVQHRVVVVLSIELHRHGEPLFAVIVPNTFQSKQMWKIMPYESGRIGDAFMTADAISVRFGISIDDLPIGSKVKHMAFSLELQHIARVVSRQSIMATDWESVRVVQRKKRGKNTKVRRIYISPMKFMDLVLRSYDKATRYGGDGLTGTVQFRFQKDAHSYAIEGLLPVELPEFGLSVAVRFDLEGRAQAICLDLHDMRNKANLIRVLRKDSSISVAYAGNQRRTDHDSGVVYVLVIEPSHDYVNTVRRDKYGDTNRRFPRRNAPRRTSPSPSDESFYPQSSGYSGARQLDREPPMASETRRQEQFPKEALFQQTQQSIFVIVAAQQTDVHPMLLQSVPLIPQQTQMQSVPPPPNMWSMETLAAELAIQKPPMPWMPLFFSAPPLFPEFLASMPNSLPSVPMPMPMSIPNQNQYFPQYQ